MLFNCKCAHKFLTNNRRDFIYFDFSFESQFFIIAKPIKIFILEDFSFLPITNYTQRKKMNKMLSKILTKKGEENVLQFLSQNLSSSELNTLLLEVFNERTQQLQARDILHNYTHNRFTQPVQGDVLQLAALELRLLQYIENKGFEIFEAGPLAPFGSCSVLGPVNQKKVVSAVRNTEVLADITNVLALEIAKRKQKASSNTTLHLSAAHRHVRGQQFDFPGFTPHFKIISLVSGGRDRGNYRFELDTIAMHTNTYFHMLQKEWGIEPERLAFKGTLMVEGMENWQEKEQAYQQMIEKMDIPAKKWEVKQQKNNLYYKSFRFNITLNLGGRIYEIIDGGSVDWTQQLLHSKKERLVISGVGLEFLHRLFQGVE